MERGAYSGRSRGQRGGRGGYVQGQNRGGRSQGQNRGDRGGYSQGQNLGGQRRSYQQHHQQTSSAQYQQNRSQSVNQQGQWRSQNSNQQSQWRRTASSNQDRQQGGPPAIVGPTTYQVTGGTRTLLVSEVRTGSSSAEDVGNDMHFHKAGNREIPSSQLESAGRIVPVKRPDRGGTLAVRHAMLRVNHFPVNFNPESMIKHYDVDIKPEVPASYSRSLKISKSDMAMIRVKLFEIDPDRFPMSMTAYDGEKNIFSAVELSTGKFKVEFSEGEDMKFRSYVFTIKKVNELKLCKLKDYLTKNVLDIPRDILQGMDVVMKEKPSRNMISVRRNFYPVASVRENDLGSGIIASKGFQHRLKATSQGLALCLDYSVLAFRKRMPVIDYLKEHIRGFAMNGFGKWRREVENALKGLKVTVTHRKTKQKYTIAGLTNDITRRLTFPNKDLEGKAPSKLVTDHFKEKYNKDILHLDVPCLNMVKKDGFNYIPMEFCVLVEGQIFPKEHLDKYAGKRLKNMSLAAPKVRECTINDMVRSNDGPCSGDVIKNFGIEVNTNMTSVEGRVLGPPDLKLTDLSGQLIKVAVDREKCHWNLVGKGVVEGRRIERWAMIDFSTDEANERFRLWREDFISKLTSRCKKLGMLMKVHPVYIRSAEMSAFFDVNMLHNLLTEVNDEASRMGRGPLQIILCVMARKHDGYKYLKWISETKIGVVTQCCLSSLANEGKDQYLANLALKINAKVGGSNVELIDRLPYFKGEDHVMFVGADVNHPGARDTSSPSIAAVVATVNWPAANRYVARVRPQVHRKENILNFADMFLELVESYAKLNGAKPKKIVLFRDGVSEGQFNMVLNEELLQVKRAFQTIKYFPTIAVIVAQKRHQTRLFLVGERDGGSTGNVSPGTVVDTTIVDPFEFDFYLCSHYGILGTSKPTHYHVLWDEHNFTSDQWQKLIYHMCFTYARCTKPVSLVPPVYYADLVAYRGRLYHEAIIQSQSQSSVRSSSSYAASSSSSLASLDEALYRLCTEMENIMFWV